jgi:NADH dehydrogenase
MPEAALNRSARTLCVLGGTGFVGSRVAAHLAAAGYQLRLPTRHPERARHLKVLPDARLLSADVHDPATLAQLLNGCDAAVNLVGILNESGFDGQGFMHAHAELARKLVTACEAAKVDKLVQISGLKADAKQGPSHYLRSKGVAEQHIADAEKLRWTILQPSVIFGPGDSFLNRFADLLGLMPLAMPLACPDARFAPVHVDDVALAVAKALDDPATDGRTFEICGPEAYSLRELVQMISEVTGKKRLIIGLPDSLARLQARILERLPGKLFTLDNYRSLSVPSICRSNGCAELGIRPRSLELNLAACLGLPPASSRNYPAVPAD